MHQAADGRDRAEHRGAERDIGHLTDGRIGQPLLQPVLRQRLERTIDDGGRRQHAEHGQQPQIMGEFDAIDVIDHAHDAEGAGLDHGDRVQQGADRRRCDHRLRQPAVQGHQCGFDAQPGQQQEEDDDELTVQRLGRRPEQTALGEGQLTDQGLEPDRADEQQHAAAHGVGQIDLGPVIGVRRAAMGDQRIGRQREDLVEDHEGHQIPRERDADGRRDAETEETEEATAVRRVLQIADGIDGRHQPQDGRQRHEQD